MAQFSTSEWRTAIRVTAVVFVIFLLQHYFRRFGMPIETVYFTILFDSIALTGLVMIAMSYLMGPLARLWPERWTKHLGLRKSFGLIGLAFVALHVILALTVLNPAYYPKIFIEIGKLSQLGEISMLAGAAALIILLIISVTSLPSVAGNMSERGWSIVQKTGLIAVILSILHFAVFKWRGWLDLGHWNNNIPPGTLVATAFVLLVFLTRLVARIYGNSKPQPLPRKQ
ncbi:MAG TPA: ferric reductase-like transmembrane domain-containing protein [Candidatus Paceibacterota bacterium]